jgi:choline kinase
LLEWQLAALNDAGINEIAIVTGYKRNLLANLGLREFNNPRWADTNMVSSLSYAATWLMSAPCIVSYSDIVYDSQAVKSLIDCKETLALAYDPNWLELWTHRFGDPLVDAETFRLGANHTIVEIGNKPTTVSEIQGQYMGLLRLTPQAWAEICRIRSDLPSDLCDQMHMTATLQKVIEAGRLAVVGVPYNGRWGEFDSVTDLFSYNKRNST